MDADLKDSVELEVRRLLAQEVAAYREHVQTIFARLVWGIGILVSVAVGGFIYSFGNTKEQLKEDLKTAVRQEVVSYQVNQGMKQYLVEQAQQIAGGPEVRAGITSTVTVAVQEALKTQAPNNVELAELLTKNTATCVRYGEAISLKTIGGVYIGTRSGHGIVNTGNPDSPERLRPFPDERFVVERNGS